MVRIQTIKRWPKASRLMILFICGAFLALAYVWSFPWLTYVRRYTSPNGMAGIASYEFGLMAIVFVVVPVLLAILSLWEQRPGRAILESWALSGGMVVTYAFHLGHTAFHLPYLSISAGFMIACVLIRLGSLVIVKRWIRRVVLDLSPHCPACGYNLTGNISGVCPECGIPFGQTADHPVTSKGF